MTLDPGIVAAVAEGDPKARAHLEALRRHHVEVVIPASVIVESTSGRTARDARVNIVIRGCRVVDTTESIARRAAALRHTAQRPDATLGAIVVATSELVGGNALLTSDPECSELAALAGVRAETP